MWPHEGKLLGLGAAACCVVWKTRARSGVGARPRRDPPPPQTPRQSHLLVFFKASRAEEPRCSAGQRLRERCPLRETRGELQPILGPELQQEMPADLEELKRLPNNELELQNKPLSPRVGALRPLPLPLPLRLPRFATTPRISPQTVLVAAGPPAPTAPGDPPSELRQSRSHARGCRGAPKPPRPALNASKSARKPPWENARD